MTFEKIDLKTFFFFLVQDMNKKMNEKSNVAA